jgi:hypothetical protein
MGKRRQPICMFILAWVELVQAAVTILTLGFVQPQWRAKVIFSQWLESLSEWESR